MFTLVMFSGFAVIIYCGPLALILLVSLPLTFCVLFKLAMVCLHDDINFVSSIIDLSA